MQVFDGKNEQIALPHMDKLYISFWTYDNFSLAGLVDGLYAVGRENFWVKFSIKNIQLTILFKLTNYLYKNEFKYGIQKKTKVDERHYETENFYKSKR